MCMCGQERPVPAAAREVARCAPSSSSSFSHSSSSLTQPRSLRRSAFKFQQDEESCGGDEKREWEELLLEDLQFTLTYIFVHILQSEQQYDTENTHTHTHTHTHTGKQKPS